jgi:hypothetical protein
MRRETVRANTSPRGLQELRPNFAGATTTGNGWRQSDNARTTIPDPDPNADTARKTVRNAGATTESNPHKTPTPPATNPMPIRAQTPEQRRLQNQEAWNLASNSGAQGTDDHRRPRYPPMLMTPR